MTIGVRWNRPKSLLSSERSRGSAVLMRCTASDHVITSGRYRHVVAATRSAGAMSTVDLMVVPCARSVESSCHGVAPKVEPSGTNVLGDLPAVRCAPGGLQGSPPLPGGRSGAGRRSRVAARRRVAPGPIRASNRPDKA